MKKLTEITEKNPFKVPENYFDDVNRKILSVTTDITPEVRKTGLFIRFRTQLAIAASVAGFILLSYTAVKLLVPENNIPRVSEVLLEGTNEAYIDDIDLSTLEENAALQGIPEEGPEVSKKDIIDYLLLDNIEINDIYEQL